MKLKFTTITIRIAEKNFARKKKRLTFDFDFSFSFSDFSWYLRNQIRYWNYSLTQKQLKHFAIINLHKYTFPTQLTTMYVYSLGPKFWRWFMKQNCHFYNTNKQPWPWVLKPFNATHQGFKKDVSKFVLKSWRTWEVRFTKKI